MTDTPPDLDRVNLEYVILFPILLHGAMKFNRALTAIPLAETTTQDLESSLLLGLPSEELLDDILAVRGGDAPAKPEQSTRANAESSASCECHPWYIELCIDVDEFIFGKRPELHEGHERIHCDLSIS
eukprot:gnl/MRDRNA2_/MRDRNA2_55957_c0_seq1.p1 gnl/MRDRNA2_/MRDRNA2_55957_c0~~gnl/MRDRNA2_/MRDRNA2_55957_c0_seq1.p1  ORF type:complete len:128 (+),score=13.06 gnl/MRDRNA2_/MRDRNA2_55957_c0_seq1:137-520(+)